MREADQTCPTCGEPVPEGSTTCPRDGTELDWGAGATQLRDPLVGRQLGEYVVKRRIGEGGMGLVYEAVHPLIGKRAAVKILRPELAEDPEQMQRLLAEARAVAAIQHRCVIDIFGFGELSDGRHYMVMEFLKGEALDLYLHRAGPLPLDEVLALLEQILSGLEAAHAVGVIHRDLKPSNVILLPQAGGTHELKVLDFGLAKQASRPHQTTPQTNANRVLGTPEYMAPEQARGQDVGPFTDLYALGVMAFEMATGRRPFTGGSLVEVLLNHASLPAPAPSSVVPSLPGAFDALVLRLLTKQPEGRPATAGEVRAEVLRLHASLPPGPRRPAARPGLGASLATPRPSANPLPSSPQSLRAASDVTQQRLAPLEAKTVVGPQPEPPPSAPLPPPRRAWPLLAGLGGLVAALGVGVVLTSAPEAPRVQAREATPPVELQKPVEPVKVSETAKPADPAPPVEVVKPVEAPAPEPVKPADPVKRPADPTSAAALRTRIAELGRRLGPGGGLARAFLEQARDDLKTAGPADRRRIAADLDEWESKYLKGK